MLSGKFIKKNTGFKSTIQLKELVKEEQTKSKDSKREEIKIQTDINRDRKTIEDIKKINKIDKPLAILTKEKREKTEITKIRNNEGTLLLILQK